MGQTEGDEQFIFILDQFKDRFADAGVKVVFFSKCTSTNRSACWLEFIDVDIMSNYVPQFNVTTSPGRI